MIQEFPTRNWSLRSLNRLIAKIKRTGSADRKHCSGGVNTARTDGNICAVEELVMSQEGQPHTHRSTRQIAREIGISKSSVLRIIHNDLRLTCFKWRRAQLLTAANKLARFTRSKQLLRRYPEHMVGFIWFTDEKLFTVMSPVNTQNDRVYARTGTLKKHVSAERLLQTRSTFGKSVMVSV